MTTHDPVLFVDEVAAELRVHPNTVRRYIKATKLQATKQGRSWYIRRSVLEQFKGAGAGVAAESLAS